jgi:hypothetical protein
MDGTYIREPDGATRLLWSRHYFNDAAAALRLFPADFRPIVPGDAQWDFDCENEAQYLTPGEWLKVDLGGALLEIGGAMGPMRAGL